MRPASPSLNRAGVLSRIPGVVGGGTAAGYRNLRMAAHRSAASLRRAIVPDCPLGVACLASAGGWAVTEPRGAWCWPLEGAAASECIPPLCLPPAHHMTSARLDQRHAWRPGGYCDWPGAWSERSVSA